MSSTTDNLAANWHKFKSQAQQEWDKLTDDDMTQLSDTAEELPSVLQQHYGYNMVEAETQIDTWLITMMNIRNHDLTNGTFAVPVLVGLKAQQTQS